MAQEVYTGRERKVDPLTARNSVSGRTRRQSGMVPKSERGFYDDSYVTVYNEKGEVVERGLWDYSVYRDESPKWNERDGNYDLRYGYKLVIKN